MSDNLDNVFRSFFEERTQKLVGRFNTPMRALVVETNDPLNMYRVRFKCPDMHDFNLPPEECPWAIPGPFGSCGGWSAPAIGDFVWIDFEKGHPYVPLYNLSAEPTRRRTYNLPSIYTPTPRPVDAKENIEIPIRTSAGTYGFFNETKADRIGKAPDDYNEDYLPKDNRPMSSGCEDRYGNLDMTSAVGFFPVTHDIEPPAPEIDPLQSSNNQDIKFNQNHQRPIPDSPDSKFMLRMSKYGNMLLMADQGYRWKKKKEDGDPKDDPEIGKLDGEFSGDIEKDYEFEIDRWKYVQKLLHEDAESGRDQRRTQIQTRYGHKMEMRDVGWNKTRPGEYSDDKRWIGVGATIHDEDKDHWGYKDPEYVDERWMKLRSKGGHLLEFSDIGSDPEKDSYVSRTLLEEIESENIDKEKEFGLDARFVRMLTRSGIKFVLDDRGSNTRTAEASGMNNDNIGIGVLIKGRRAPACGYRDNNAGTQNQWLPSTGWKDDAVSQTEPAFRGDPTGFYFQIDERVDKNQMVLGSPLGSAITINDKEEYIGICSRLSKLPETCKFLTDNEFLEKDARELDFEVNTHHLSIDHFNERIRLKTRASKGDAPDGVDNPAYKKPSSGEQQGIELHDGPENKAWAEFIDIEKRGLWFSQDQGLGIWRARTDSQAKKIYIWLEDKEKDQIILHNDEATGRVQIFCQGNVDIIAGNNIAVQAGKQITLKAQDSINMDVGGAMYSFGRTSFNTNKDINANEVRARFPEVKQGTGAVAGRSHANAANGSAVSSIIREPAKNIIEPTDRAT